MSQTSLAFQTPSRGERLAACHASLIANVRRLVREGCGFLFSQDALDATAAEGYTREEGVSFGHFYSVVKRLGMVMVEENRLERTAQYRWELHPYIIMAYVESYEVASFRDLAFAVAATHDALRLQTSLAATQYGASFKNVDGFICWRAKSMRKARRKAGHDFRQEVMGRQLGPEVPQDSRAWLPVPPALPQQNLPAK